MYADRVTDSMKAAIEETERRRGIQERYNVEHGIEPQTIIKGIHDINDRLRTVAENTIVYSSERRAADLASADRAEVEKLVARMEAEMKSAAKQLEFERAAALRDEVQQIRLRVLEQDASVVVARAAERAAKDALLPAKERAAAHRPGAGHAKGGRRSRPSRSPRSRSLRLATSRQGMTGGAAALPRTCSPAFATSTMTRTRAGRRAGSTGPPGTGP